ncbi:MAG: hypothetical protein RL156_543 [Bacteroidota bacterium]
MDPFEDIIAPDGSDGDAMPISKPKKVPVKSITRRSTPAGSASRAPRAIATKSASPADEALVAKLGSKSAIAAKDGENSARSKPAKGSPVPLDGVDMFAQAMELFKRKQYAECITLLQKSTAQSVSTESVAQNSYWIGESNFVLGKYEEAIRWY